MLHFYEMAVKHMQFNNQKEEIEYLWNTNAELRQQLKESKEHEWQLNTEYEELRENSWQLEKELEANLEQSEKQKSDLKKKYCKLQNEFEELKERAEESRIVCDVLTEEINKYRHKEKEWQTQVQELEQKNDDLERSLRAVHESHTQTELQLGDVLEHGALLEGEREELQELVQRLRQEKGELAEELRARARLLPSHCELDELIAGQSSASVETQTQALACRPFKSKLGSATRALGRSLNCMKGSSSDSAPGKQQKAL